MDDMTAFERQVAREVVREAGPEPHVDALAIARSITTMPHRGSSSLRLRAAALVIGVLTVVSGGVLLGLLVGGPGPVPEPASSPHPDQPAIHWRTDHVDLGAEAISVALGGRTLRYSADGAQVVRCGWCRWLTVHWPGDPGLPPISVMFDSDEDEWWVNFILVGTQQLEFVAPRRTTRTPIGESFVGDLRLTGDGFLPGCDPAANVRRPAVLAVDRLRLRFVPSEPGPVDTVLQFLDDPSAFLYGGLSHRGEPGTLYVQDCVSAE